MQNASILFKLFDGNKILGALEYSGENPKFDENGSKILQNHIVIEFDDLRASFWVMTLVDGAKRIYFIQAFWW